jgi:putative SOS response-associated peptidase YedK
VRADEDGRRADMLHWGLVPRWAEGPSIGNCMINARAETAAE